MSDLNKLEEKRQRVFIMMAGCKNPRTGKLVTAGEETLRLIELVNDYGDVLKHLEAAQQRIAELEYSCKVSDGACSIAEQQRGHWMQRANVAEAELARRDAAASEPVYIYGGAELSKDKADEYKTFGREIRVLYREAQPSALPSEIDTSDLDRSSNEREVIINIAGCDGYNQAIADAKMLGCKAIKLPEPYDDGHGNEWLPRGATIQTLKLQGFTVEGE